MDARSGGACWKFLAGAVLLAGLTGTVPGSAQETDRVLNPNPENAGIAKSLAQQVGASRGDDMLPDSSIFIIERDPFRSVRRGRQLFQRKFTREQGNGPRVSFTSAGPIAENAAFGAGLADSCAACHGRPRGSAGVGGDVFTRPDSRDAPHLFGLGLVEMLADEITADLRAARDQALLQAALQGRPVNRALASKGISYGRIRAYPNGTVDTSRLEGVDPDLRVKPLFHDGRSFSIRAFAVGAFNDEMGLQSFDPDLLTAAMGGTVTTPSGMFIDGTADPVSMPPATSAGADPDGDGVTNEIDVALVDHMEFYLLHYFKAGTYKETESTRHGRRLMDRVGCTTCHIPDLLINRDRRVADVETVYDPQQGIFNNLFSTAMPRLVVIEDPSGHPAKKRPSGEPFLVRNIFADFKRHDLGPAFHERNFNGTITTKFMTEPLWGAGTTAPYGHDGRSINLMEVILRHGGEAQGSRDDFEALNDRQKEDVIAFLNSLILFPPDDTASNLDPGNPAAPNFPQRGHGSIRLTALFNNPADVE